MAINPLILQGTLNRIRGSVIVPSFSSLNVTSSYMGKRMYAITFDGDFAEMIGTATGAVTSPEPYVMASIEINLLRTQSLSSAWLNQSQTTSSIGEIQCHSDTSAFPMIQIDNCIIKHVDPGVFDGTDPVCKIHLQGLYYLNNNLWNLL